MSYVASSGGAAVEQSDSAVLAVRLCVSVVPALALHSAIASILNYDLDPASLEDT